MSATTAVASNFTPKLSAGEVQNAVRRFHAHTARRRVLAMRNTWIDRGDAPPMTGKLSSWTSALNTPVALKANPPALRNGRESRESNNTPTKGSRRVGSPKSIRAGPDDSDGDDGPGDGPPPHGGLRPCQREGCVEFLPLDATAQRKFCDLPDCVRKRAAQRQAKKRHRDSLPDPATGIPKGPGLPPRGEMVLPGGRHTGEAGEGSNVKGDGFHVEDRDGWMRPAERNDPGRLWLLQQLLYRHEEGCYSLADLANLFGIDGPDERSRIQSVKRNLRRAEKVRDCDPDTLKKERFDLPALKKADFDPIALAEAKHERLFRQLDAGDPWAETDSKAAQDKVKDKTQDPYEELQSSPIDASQHEWGLPA